MIASVAFWLALLCGVIVDGFFLVKKKFALGALAGFFSFLILWWFFSVFIPLALGIVILVAGVGAFSGYALHHRKHRKVS